MPTPAEVSLQSNRKKLVLCIDDDQATLHVRKFILQSAGYDVIVATSGRIGLRLLRRHPVQLVILDYRMPEADGEAVARAIRRTHLNVPIFRAIRPRHLNDCSEWWTPFGSDVSQ